MNMEFRDEVGGEIRGLDTQAFLAASYDCSLGISEIVQPVRNFTLTFPFRICFYNFQKQIRVGKSFLF